jgi:hypothetical protein
MAAKTKTPEVVAHQLMIYLPEENTGKAMS